MKTPTTNYEAMVLALQLAIIAPTEEQANECLEIAKTLDLSEFEVAGAKKEALRQVEENFDDADLSNMIFAFNNAAAEFNKLKPSEYNVAKALLELRDRIEILIIENSAAGGRDDD